MTFSIGDRVISERVRGRIGIIVRVRKLAALFLVDYSRNLRVWIDDEDLHPAVESRAPMPPNGRSWFDARELPKAALDRQTEIARIRELTTINGNGQARRVPRGAAR
jgi:hypothetical protein